jgi:hypothetical protein
MDWFKLLKNASPMARMKGDFMQCKSCGEYARPIVRPNGVYCGGCHEPMQGRKQPINNQPATAIPPAPMEAPEVQSSIDGAHWVK